MSTNELVNEVLRVVARGGVYGTFTLADGAKVEGATETDVKRHLTSGRDFVPGRQWRFPGIASGWEFESALQGAGFRIVKARNYRGQVCNVVTI
jgi:hypothetical protein